MSQFEGIWVPLITPFRDGQVDPVAAARLAAHLAAEGVNGLIVCGTTGEAAALSQDEQSRLLGAVIQAVRGRCPVAMGLAGSNTAAVREAARRFDDFELAGLLVSAPSYVRPSQDGIRRHFDAIADATRLPIMIYNIPYRTGVNIELATVQALCDNPQFVAIKESGGGNMNQLMDLIAHTRLKVLSGEDHLIFVSACLGGHGAVAAAAHIRPDLYLRMLAQLRAGELAGARAIHLALRPVLRLLFSEPNPGPLKAALALQGWTSEELRLPMLPASAACRDSLREALAALDRELPRAAATITKARGRRLRA